MLTEVERRSLCAIEREELARDPEFASFMVSGPATDHDPRHWLGRVWQSAWSWLSLCAGPVLVVVAATLIVTALYLDSNAWAVVGTAVAVVGLILSVRPVTIVARKCVDAIAHRHR